LTSPLWLDAIEFRGGQGKPREGRETGVPPHAPPPRVPLGQGWRLA